MAHISAVCPRCGSRYHLDPNLLGKQMRCPNAVCRAIFEVHDETAAAASPGPEPKSEAPPPPRVGQTAGAVGDIVPILRAEQVEASPPPPIEIPEQEAARGWHEMAPPVRVRDGAVPAEGRYPSEPATDGLSDTVVSELEAPADVPLVGDLPEGLRELGPDAWAAPPVRAAEPDGFAQRQVVPPDGLLREQPPPEVMRARRRSRWLMVALLLLLAGGMGLAAWAFVGRRSGDEAERWQRAEKLYEDREFGEAARVLQTLQRDFPNSSKIKLYRFLAELADVREPVYQSQGEPEEAYKALGRVAQFAQVYHKDPLLRAREPELWSTLRRIAEDLSEAAERAKERRLVDRARLALGELSKFQAPSGTNARDTIQQLERRLTAAKTAIASREHRQGVLGDLRGLVAKASAQAVREARGLAARAELTNDPEAQTALRDLVKAHIAGVTYTPVLKSVAPPSEEETQPSVLLAPERNKGTLRSGVNATVFALARGVLYGLDARDGAVRWGRRVGVDARVLPLRLPASAVAPEAVIVVSPDRQTVCAHQADSGAVLWRHALSGPCVALPLRVGGHLFVPSLSGRVEEIELTGGKLLGYYELGQPLLVGGVHQQGTGLVYFPADEFTIYVLDVAKQKCAGVLYTNHARGALRAPPVIRYGDAPAKESNAVGAGDRLLLLQASGLRELAIKAFTLPIVDPDQKPLEPGLAVRGRIDFPPWQDAERLALVTDAGTFEVYGEPTQNRKDFPLARLFGAELGVDPPDRGASRSQIVHADADNFWVASAGRLHRLQTLFAREGGPTLTPRWPVPPLVGAPLHAAEVFADDRGDSVLFLAGQERTGPTCVLHALDAASGKSHWQRQLGILCEQAAALGEGVLVRDRHGLFLFDAKDLGGPPSATWIGGSASRTALARAQGGRCFGRDHDAYFVTWSLDRNSPALHLYHVEKEEGAATSSPAISLPGAMAGAPALGNDSLIAALENGLFVHVSLGDRAVTPGPSWPAAAIEDPGPRYIVFLGGADFLATDGYRGMKIYRWPTANQVSPLSEEYQLALRIAGPPIVVRAAKGEATYRIAATDTGGTLHLLQSPPWAPVRSWALGGKITAGPVLLGKHLACVVDQRRITWLDPERDDPVWEYSVLADVVGEPQLVGQTVVIASVAGQFLGLDAATGRPLGAGYTLRADVAPAVAPVPLGPDRLFAPLTDGTILLLSLKQLR